MPASALPARLAALVLSIAVGLAAGLAGAQPAPATPPAPGAPPPPAAAPSAPPEPVTLDVGVRIGGVYRFGGAPAFAVTGRGGPLLGVGLVLAPSSRFSVGLAYEHAGLGSEHGQGDLGVVDLDRSTDSLWASLRLTLFRVD